MTRVTLVAATALVLGAFLGGLGVFLYFMLLREPTLEKVAQGIGGLGTAAGTAGALLIAWTGLRTWSHQLRGTARFNACRKFLDRVYRVRAAIDTFRNPTLKTPEMQAAMHAHDKPFDPNNDDQVNEAHDFAMRDRWADVVKWTQQCQDAAIAVEALLGSVIHEPLRNLRAVVREILFSWQQQERRKVRGYRQSELPAIDNDDDVLWDTGATKFSKKIEDAVRSAEFVVREHIRDQLA